MENKIECPKCGNDLTKKNLLYCQDCLEIMSMIEDVINGDAKIYISINNEMIDISKFIKKKNED